MFVSLRYETFINSIKNGFISLSSPNFRKFFLGQTTSFIGSWVQNIGMGWLVYRLTGSIALLGVVGFSSQIPALLITPFAGVFADKLNRKKVMLFTQLTMMMVALLFATLTLTNTITVGIIVFLSVINGLVVAFDTPFRHSILSDLLDNKEHLSNAVALNSIMVNTSRLVGPALAGFLISAFGEGVCFLVNSLSFLAIIIALLSIRIKTTQVLKQNFSPKAITDELMNGIRYAQSNAGFRQIFLIVFLSSLLCLPFQNLMPAFAKDVFSGDSKTLGLLSGAFGLGALIGAVVLGQISTPLKLVRLIGIAGILLSGGIIIFSSSSMISIAYIALAIAGFGMISQFASSNTIIQVYSKSEFRGRMVSLYNVSFLGLTPIGSLLLGFAAQHIGLQLTIIISSVIFMAMSINYLFRYKFVQQKIQS
ncbi:MFS transporter [Acetobacteroides hydrogenigenes]|uniref:Transmembrane secretion effector n=1 Tax=Acetobacteroides hydrogenigenes TaxID=979970 RepID=A0A4R2EM28_9BACT|nr:MFS transporter [Acetobacteroides hydrogenigenes]TCN68436.1 transmembrane secretion effector [Acetobacteroides hydrogenigenes]